jgi:cobyrinic acid a,c-diamide synthase
MALVIAGERSGVGKTTVALSLLATLNQQQRRVQSFKVGPDYIDPMFHQHITGRACRNLDPILTSEAYVQSCFADSIQDAACVLIEGVMGLFDGATGADDVASTAHIARLLNLPILLVLDCSHLSRSVAAIAHGYRSFDPRLQIAGVVLNRVGSDRHLELLQTALDPLNLPILGVLRRQDNITIPDRHLGLVPVAELPDINELFKRLAHLGATCFDWTRLWSLLAREQGMGNRERGIGNREQGMGKQGNETPRIAVAHDCAFSFYYRDNLDLLKHLGAELIFWSPLSDCGLPQGVNGLYFGGGFPELLAEALSTNQSAMSVVRSAIHAGMPTYAECGGLMYLCRQIVDFEERAWQMVGILPTVARMGQRLTLGYRQAIALQDSPLLPAGATVWGHEFHRSTLQGSSQTPLYQLQGYDQQGLPRTEGWRSQQVHASYIHLHWGARPEIPNRFIEHCSRWRG